MNLNSIQKFTVSDYESVGIITTADSLNTLEKDFPELKDYIAADFFTCNNTTVNTLSLIVDKKKVEYFVLGLKDDVDAKDLLDAFGLMGKAISETKAEKNLLHLASAVDLLAKDMQANVLAAVKGFILGSYSFNKYVTSKKSKMPEFVDLYSKNEELEALIPSSLTIANSILLSRSLVDEPANLMTPEILANRVVEEFKDTNIEVSVLEDDEIKALDMNLYLAVAQGATNRPRLIVMRYNGNPDSDLRMGLIGKGITYDTGGYSIKPTGGMITMKSDMGGGAAVIGAMSIIASEQPKVNVVGVIAACENRIAGNAYLPGDILTSMNGKTVEITNTDAEGRLTLADAMTYAIRKENATNVLDICTLTGACVVALGEEFAGVVTKSDEHWKQLESIAERTLEPCWRLPLTKTLEKKNRSKVADLKNSTERWGSAITAGSFVGEFSEGKPWIHIDVAGTAYIETDKPYLRAGGTGFGAHLLAEYVKEYADK